MLRRFGKLHPGEILRDELAELDLWGSALARAPDVPSRRIASILNGQRSVTANTALRLGRYFGPRSQMLLNLQTMFELRQAEIASGKRVAEQVLPRPTAVTTLALAATRGSS